MMMRLRQPCCHRELIKEMDWTEALVKKEDLTRQLQGFVATEAGEEGGASGGGAGGAEDGRAGRRRGARRREGPGGAAKADDQERRAGRLQHPSRRPQVARHHPLCPRILQGWYQFIDPRIFVLLLLLPFTCSFCSCSIWSSTCSYSPPFASLFHLLPWLLSLPHRPPPGLYRDCDLHSEVSLLPALPAVAPGQGRLPGGRGGQEGGEHHPRRHRGHQGRGLQVQD